MSDSSAVDTGAGSLFRSVDVATFAGALVLRLRDAGVEIGPTAANRFARAVRCCPPTDVTTIYWVAKTSLLSDRRDFATFDRLFEALFGGRGLPIAPWERSTGRATVRTEGSLLRRSAPVDGFEAVAARIARPGAEIVDDDDESEAADVSTIAELLPAPLAGLADTPFDQLSVEQLTAIGRWMEEAMADLPHRVSRRRVVAHSGAVDMRRTLRSARSTGEITTLARYRPRLEPRPVMMLADVSGSMESYSRIYLHLMRVLAASGEVFTFATSLRRVTVQLRERDPQAAIDRLSDEVVDRFGGTRISASLGELLASPRWSHAVRGATVVIASDGWDSGPPQELAKRVARLRRMSHRVVWINPRSAAVDYQPLVAGMAEALPHIDDFLSGHSLRAMADVVAALTLGGAGHRRY